MTNECRVEAVITATPAQLDAIAAIVGTENVHRAVIGANNIAAFWDEGPKILEQLAQAYTAAEQPRLKTWDELNDDTRETIVSLAAGSFDWADDGTLHDYYIEDTLGGHPELRAALLRPESRQPA